MDCIIYIYMEDGGIELSKSRLRGRLHDGTITYETEEERDKVMKQYRENLQFEASIVDAMTPTDRVVAQPRKERVHRVALGEHQNTVDRLRREGGHEGEIVTSGAGTAYEQVEVI